MKKTITTKIKTNFKYPKLKASDRSYGVSLGQVIRESGDWRDFLPPLEDQNQRGVESSACYVEGSQHAIAITQEEEFGVLDQNYSARFNALLSDGTEGGGDPVEGGKSIKFDGLIPEELMSFTGIDNWDEYHSWSGVEIAKAKREAEIFKDKWDLSFKILVERDLPLKTKYLELREGLKRSPVPLSVCAWYEKGGEYYKPEGKRDNHFVVGLYVDNQDRIHILDTYAPYLKVLAPKTDFEFALSWVVKKKPYEQRAGIMKQIIAFLSQLIAKLKETPKKEVLPPVVAPQPQPEPIKSLREKLYDEAVEWIGKEASPKDFVSDSVACAESFCNVISNVIDFPMIVGTATLFESLKKDKRLEITTDLKAGNVIISPTGYGNGLIQGHVGILLEGGKIASNSSENGLWIQNYDVDSWVKRYRVKGGFPVVIFELK